MSSLAVLAGAAPPALLNLSLFSLLRGVLSLSVLSGLVVFFKPLLSGIARATLLLFKPRLSLEERVARSTWRDAQMMQQMINAAQGPSHAAELRAMAARA